MPRSNRPEQMRAKATRSRCDGSMLAWTLKTNAENGALEGRGSPSSIEPRRRRRGQLDDRVEQHAHAEVGQRRADEHRRRLAGEERRQVDVGADRVEQRGLVERGPPAPTRVVLGRWLRRRRRSSPPAPPTRRGRAGEPRELGRCGGRSRRGSPRRCRPATSPVSVAARSASRSRRAAPAARGPAGRTC